MKLLLTGLMTAALLSGCATKVKGLKKSETFTFENVKSGKIIVAGVVDATGEGKIDYKKNISLANALKNQIIEERAMFSVNSAGLVVKKLGKKNYLRMLSAIEEEGRLGQEDIMLLKKSLTGRRYVVFARVESDDVSKNRDTRTPTDSQGNVTGPEQMVTRVNRSIETAYQVYDLVEGNLAWSGNISKSTSKESNYVIKKDSGLVSLVKAIKGTEEDNDVEKNYPYPKTPSRKYVMNNSFRGFAENLPEED